MRFDDEAVRILARKGVIDTVDMRERLVLMAMAITKMDSTRCLVDVRVNFANEHHEYAKHDKLMIRHYFTLLFRYLDSVFLLD